MHLGKHFGTMKQWVALQESLPETANEEENMNRQ